MQNSVLKAVVLLLICVASWGSVFPLGQMVLQSMDGVIMAFWRSVLAVLTLGLILLIRRQTGWRLPVWQYLIIFVVGAIGIGGLNIGIFYGLSQTPAINAALIMALSPVVNSVLEAILSRQWLKASQVFSLIMGVCGVCLVITQGELSRLSDFSSNTGDLWYVGGMLSWSIYTLASKRISHWLPVLSYTTVTMLAGTIVIWIASVPVMGLTPWDQLVQLGPRDLTIVIYIGLFATVLGFMLWIQGVKMIGVQSASLFFNLVPVFAALISLLLGHPVTAIQWTGMGVVLVGLIAPRLLGWLRQRATTH